MRILVIEDDPDAARYLVKGLKESGHVVDHAAKGKDGLFLAMSERHDVLVVDRMLPEVNGLAIIEAIRTAGKKTPVLVLSALSAVDNIRQLHRYASGYEPNRIRELSDALEARGLHVAEAGYWRAYKITFLTQERLKLAAVGSQRIDEYRRLADQEGNRLLRLAERPCPGGEPVVEHYLCPK